MATWNDEERILIKWVLDYLNDRTITRDDKFYSDLLEEIKLGADSPRARTGELQNGLRLMKYLVEHNQ